VLSYPYLPSRVEGLALILGLPLGRIPAAR
jgi:hypothetical protein